MQRQSDMPNHDINLPVVSLEVDPGNSTESCTFGSVAQKPLISDHQPGRDKSNVSGNASLVTQACCPTNCGKGAQSLM